MTPPGRHLWASPLHARSNCKLRQFLSGLWGWLSPGSDAGPASVTRFLSSPDGPLTGTRRRALATFFCRRNPSGFVLRNVSGWAIS